MNISLKKYPNKSKDFINLYNIYLDDEEVGSVELIKNTKSIESFFIDENYRGRGIGTEVLKKATELGYTNICVVPSNTGAIKLYEKCGFKPVLIKMQYRKE